MACFNYTWLFSFAALALILGVIGTVMYLMTPMRSSEHLKFGKALSLPAHQLLQDRRVILSCTSSPARIQYLHNVLFNLDLTLVHRIVIALPERFKNSEDDAEALYPSPLPAWIRHSKLVKVVRIQDDPGPIAKLTPALQLYPNSIIITVDDDTKYHSGIVKQLLNSMAACAERNAGECPIVAGWARPLHDWRYNTSSKWSLSAKQWPVDPRKSQYELPAHHIQGHIVEGFASAAYPAWRMQPERLVRMAGLSSATRASDDVVISFHAAELHIPIVSQKKRRPPVRQYSYGYMHDALHMQGSMIARYQQAVNELRFFAQSFPVASDDKV